MDHNLAPAIRRRIKSVKAEAFGRAITEGHSATTARMIAEKTSRSHWREQLTKAQDRRDTRAGTLKRILIKEGILQ